jgi:hypothetical protein
MRLSQKILLVSIDKMQKILGYFLFFTFFFQGCQLVTAKGEEELNFEVKNNWEYAAEVAPPNLMEQVLKDNLDPKSNWVGDPKRFQVIKINYLGQKSPLYLIDPKIYYECPKDKGCNLDLLRLYYPFCGATGGCSYFAYIEENGTYRPVFQQLIWRLSANDFFKVSRQLYQGFPACFELTGYDSNTKLQGLPRIKEDQVFVSRYCYNGSQYILDKLYPKRRA